MFCLLLAWLQRVGSCSSILVEPIWVGNAFAPPEKEQSAAWENLSPKSWLGAHSREAVLIYANPGRSLFLTPTPSSILVSHVGAAR